MQLISDVATIQDEQGEDTSRCIKRTVADKGEKSKKKRSKLSESETPQA
jgi:hypothetical protein